MAKSFQTELKNILAQKATDEEKTGLLEKGIHIKNPTKQTVLAAALYEKAAKGDLSSLKEIFCRIGLQTGEGGGVVLIDDIANKNK